MLSNMKSAIEGHFTKTGKKIEVSNVHFETVKDGLSNYTYKADAQGSHLFLKVFGKLKETEVVDRKFESYLIDLCSKDGRCPKMLDTDNTTFRIDEFWENLTHPDQSELFTKSFLDKLLPQIIAFELTLHNNKEITAEYPHISIKSFLTRAVKAASTKFDEFTEKFQQFKLSSGVNGTGGAFNEESLKEIKYYLDNFDVIFDKLYLNLEQTFILSHNDIYKNNIIRKDNGEDLKLIDYEYAALNFIGSDIINYSIESFFDLTYSEYPFYKKVGNINDLFNDKKHFELYLQYLDLFAEKSKDLIEFKDSWKQKDYFVEVAGVMSLFWFYMAILFLDFDSNINKTGFNYIDYAVDRLAVYKKSQDLVC